MKSNFYIILLVHASIGNGAKPTTFSSSNTANGTNVLDCEYGTFLADSVCLPKRYLKGQVPKIPTRVASRLEISNIREVNDKKMRISLEIYQEMMWIDNRVKTSLSENEIL